MLDRSDPRRIHELRPGRGQFVNGRRHEACLSLGVPALVAALAAGTEHVTVLADTPVRVNDRQVAPWFQRGGRFNDPDGGINPVPGRRCDYEVEGFRWQLEVLEPALDDLDVGIRCELAASDQSQLRARFQRGDTQAPFCQRDCDLTRAAANLQDPLTGLDSSEHEEVVDKFPRVQRPSAVVEISDVIEGFGTTGHAGLSSTRQRDGRNGQPANGGQLQGGGRSAAMRARHAAATARDSPPRPAAGDSRIGIARAEAIVNRGSHEVRLVNPHAVERVDGRGIKMRGGRR